MRTFIFLCTFLLNAVLFAQTPAELEGSYVSKKKYNDVWTLKLNKDLIYTFDSQKGESLDPGKWKIEEGVLVLTTAGNTTVKLSIKQGEDRIILTSGRKDFIKLKLTRR